ncbi:ribosome maturation factor RimM [Sandaracinobacteroides saxicola]|uniref:Ribosome maturation factor RimM n=1 Tax=Sandaracinobacteroides saxicola TaxID=2759707 RepID=A0A7G5IJF4_9SPHN|nr:ribosome maturation factor RimM [Sandaracinobacteroides saxicola]QMW23496.1 16S rRNA processing protein RimM [Sandaracinobacteroides saxicola]
MNDRPVTLAAVAGAHGVTGEVRLKLFTADPDGLKNLSGLALNGQPVTLKSLRPGPQGAVARFAELGSREAAESARGTLLTAPRSALPPLAEGEYYWHDLIGLPVVTPDGTPAGSVVAVENYGASDLLDIEKPDGKRVLVPLIPAAVPALTAPLIIDTPYLA